MKFEDIHYTVFKAQCEELDDLYRRGKMMDPHKYEHLRYKLPAPVTEKGASSLQTVANIYDLDSANWCAKELRGLKRGAVAVSFLVIATKGFYAFRCM